ncbi:MAG: methyltransferase [Candidatus Heimdallarchaeota archaeon]|nr:MAG: methyltransferase [Candidatus Heimdallarchaeota archaeon]
MTETVQDIEKILRMYLASAAVGTALELGLFWQLEEKPMGEKEISRILNIPYDRCRSWLQLLAKLDLLELQDKRFVPSIFARTAILEAYSQETWTFLAQEIREQYQVVNNLALNISHPESVWVAQRIQPPNYITLMKNDPRRAERFTRMLYELHQPLAEKLVNILDLTNVGKLMDLGGGSGVVSLALLEHHKNLNAVVVDIENVCNTGRKIANETQVADRITYHPADFIQNPLPSGFDMIIECDVGVYNQTLFHKLFDSLNTGGRFMIISNTNEQGAWLTYPKSESSLLRILNAFLSSLTTPRFVSSTIDDIKSLLTKTGFRDVFEQVHEDGMVFIQATK